MTKIENNNNIKLYIITILLIILIFVALFFFEKKSLSILNQITSTSGNFKKNEAFELLATKNSELLEKSIWRIEQMGEIATIVLIKMLEDNNMATYERINVIYALGRLKEKAIKSEIILIGYLQAKNPDIRAISARTLGKMKSKLAVYDLRDMLEDDNKWVRDSALYALKEINTKASQKIIKNYNTNNFTKNTKAE